MSNVKKGKNQINKLNIKQNPWWKLPFSYLRRFWEQCRLNCLIYIRNSETKRLKWWHAPTHQKPRDVESVRPARASPPQKGRIIRRRHTRSHLKVWEYFHKKPHIQLPAHSFYENNEWFLYFSLILCRFYPRQRGGEPLWLSPRSVFDFLL